MSHGEQIEQAIEAVERWKSAHGGDANAIVVEEWIRKAEEQIATELETQKIMKRRLEATAAADKAIRENKLDPELREIARNATLRARGIEPDEDA